MSLTEKERIILQYREQGLSDYKIAQIINMHAPSVNRSRKNATRKLKDAKLDLRWAKESGVSTPRLNHSNCT
jgi:hypothetical protein